MRDLRANLDGRQNPQKFADGSARFLSKCRRSLYFFEFEATISLSQSPYFAAAKEKRQRERREHRRMWPTTRFSPHAKKQIVELAKKEQMLTLPQMDTIVRLSCNTAPLSRFSMLPTARGLRLFSPVDDSWTGQPQESVVPSALWAPVVRREEDLLFEQCVFRPHMSEVRAQRIDWEKTQERRVLQREEEQEREEKEREELREAERRQKRELDTATTTKTTITPPGLAVQAQQQQHQKEEDDYEFKPTSTKQTTQRSASERMKQRLTLYGLKEIEVEGNGNCQFAAASQGIYGNQKQHKQVREKAVTWYAI